MERSEWDDAKDAEIARVLGELSDLTEEEEALAACRREAAQDSPALVAAEVAADLLSLAGDPETRRSTRALLLDLRGRFEAIGETEAARVVDAALAEGR